MMTLHEAIEQVIRKAGRPLSSREICDLVNSQRLYVREDGKPVPTSQIGARVRQSPQWLKKVGNLITLANDSNKVSASTPREGLKKLTAVNSGQAKDVPLLLKQLVNSKNYKSVGSIDNKVPDTPGLYMIRVQNINSLPQVFKKELESRKHNILYVGIATKSLQRRMLGQELRAKGHGTFFRSIGAVLGFEPPKGSLVHKKNKRNYTFSISDERKIIDWINHNLLVNWISYDTDFATLETTLINEYRPIINIAKNPYSMQELSELRKRCVDIANT
jgi:hypothetical protein